MIESLLLGDCREVLATLPDASIDACVTDPPYELGFVGKAWDKSGVATDPATWRAVHRVLKPGAYLLACGGTRTYHRMAVAIEDAGFEIRDCLAWLYASGFPKSLNLGDGLGTALKPAYEPIVLARKRFTGTVAVNVTVYRTGALNIDACRIETGENLNGGAYQPGDGQRHDGTEHWRFRNGDRAGIYHQPSGRWPANVLLDEGAARVLDEQSGNLGLSAGGRIGNAGGGIVTNVPIGAFSVGDPGFGDRGGASRFFFTAKPSREERDAGCEGLAVRDSYETVNRDPDSAGVRSPRAGAGRMTPEVRNHHTTVKPVALMRWLVRLITPIGGTVLDPFLGSGTTGMACRAEQRGYIGIEQDAAYLAIARARIVAVAPLFTEAAMAESEPSTGDLLAVLAQ